MTFTPFVIHYIAIRRRSHKYEDGWSAWGSYEDGWSAWGSVIHHPDEHGQALLVSAPFFAFRVNDDGDRTIISFPGGDEQFLVRGSPLAIANLVDARGPL